MENGQNQVKTFVVHTFVSLAVSLYVVTCSSVVVLKAIFHSNSKQSSSSPPACSQGQTAVSLHCDTRVVQGQPLNGATKARVL